MHFRVRETGGSRLEALSDGVFALAIAILLISSSVPSNYQELLLFVQDIIPFGGMYSIYLLDLAPAMYFFPQVWPD